MLFRSYETLNVARKAIRVEPGVSNMVLCRSSTEIFTLTEIDFTKKSTEKMADDIAKLASINFKDGTILKNLRQILCSIICKGF